MKLLPVLAALTALILPCAAGAYVPVPQAMTCMLYFKSDAIFTGEVTAVESVKGLGSAYTLKVLKPYRNAKAGGTMKVFSASGADGMRLEQGKQYLLFAFNQDFKLTVINDQSSGELKDRQQVLQDLDKIAAHRPDGSGDIYGRVTKRVFSTDSGGIAGIPVTLQGPDGNKRVVTDQNGWFKLHVSAGSYSATALSPMWKFQSEGLAWEDAGGFQVPDGGCAEIQIQALPKSDE